MITDTVPEYILGMDLGTNSLGWAIVGLIDGEPASLLDAGVRTFDAGMKGDLESGGEESRNKARRDARLHRRQLDRHRRRLTKVLHLLQRYGLLPPDRVSLPDERQDLWNRLDQEILASPWFKPKIESHAYSEPQQTLPYILRASSLDEELEPYFLGRAFYHLAQRRGFLSNRKQVAKKDEDEGQVKEAIADLRKAMTDAKARTLGEYFSRLKPSEQRIRSRWTARDMYEHEFQAIWEAQAAHHPDVLTSERKSELYQAIFYQRPLWFDRNTIGQCELEPDEHRAPAYLLASQRFRLLQTVNNLKLLPPGETERPLTPEDRKKLVDELQLQDDLTFNQIRKLLGLTKEYQFNLERGGEKKLKGNRTNADFYSVFGERWRTMSAGERDRAVEYVHAFQKPQKLREAARKKWGLSEEVAEKLSEISLEPDYMSLSRRAMEKLLPQLEAGVTYGEARKAVFPESFETSTALPQLPPVSTALAEIRNPAVMRSLTELRKVVNALARKYGKPVEIRIELARDLKKSKKQRQAISEINRRNEKARAEGAKKIMAEAGIQQPKRDDTTKFLLAEECHWMCPYTGKSISMQALFGPEPQFDLEHIIPFSRSMDNSFQNLTLCYIPENRDVKGNKTPYQAYAGNPEPFEQILDRVRKFTGDRRTIAAKLKRFTLTDDELETFLADFRNRQLNDTAYASALAAKYLGLLYGGINDAEGKKRVQATSGQATSYFRNLWKLNAILNDGPTTGGGFSSKSREDHRHHAVDAVVIVLTDAGMIKRLADAAKRAPLEHHRRFASLEAPWPNFVDTVRAKIGGIIVSHRVSKKISGALHEETNYSAPYADRTVRVRKPLASLTKTELADIADEGVRALILRKLEELGEGDPKKAFAKPENLPRFPSSGVVIKRARITKAVPTFTLGSGRSARHVASESNHHVEIYAEVDKNGNEGQWDGEVVPLQEAYRRLRAGEPVVQRDHGPLVKFKFSLAPTESVECADKAGGRGLYVVRKLSHLSSGQIQIGLAPVADARKAKEQQTSRAWLWVNPDTLRRRKPHKVVISPLGEVTEAHD